MIGEDGEKYACSACVRGHRVSNCTHSDRELQHIAKKGRPVSQCPHCQGHRRSRNAHTKCTCRERPHTKNDCKKTAANRASQRGECCCSHGLSCTCSVKKPQLNSVSELPPGARNRSRASTDSRKPRLNAAHSDPVLTVFNNGHHRPVHRLNHAGQECGVPYRIPRPHSIHGQLSTARKSTDSLPLLDTGDFDAGFIDQANMPNDERMASSENGSPGLNPLLYARYNHMSPMTLDYQAINTSITSSPTADEYSYNNFDNYVSQNDEQASLDSYVPTSEDQVPLDRYLPAGEQVPPATNLDSDFNWSAMDLPLQTAFNQNYSQAPSYASFDQGLRRPELTPSSSGEVSEVDDFMGQSVSSPAVADASPYITSPGENGVFSYSLSGESYINQAPMIPVTNMENMSMESFFPVPTASSVDYSEYESGNKLEADAFSSHGLPIHVSLGHSGLRSEANAEIPVRTAGPTSDPKWSDSGYNNANWT